MVKLEIEAKMRVAEVEAVRQRLNDASATYVGRMFEDNIFLDDPKRSLSSSDRGLRLRRVSWPEDNREPRIELTFKGPRQEGTFKSRREIELLISDADQMLALFEELGYQQTLRFQKRRERWRLDEATVELDELPHLGSFVEIEAPDEATVLTARTALVLDEKPIIKSSYASLLQTYLNEHGLIERAVRFDTQESPAGSS